MYHSTDALSAIITSAIDPAHFYVGNGLDLVWQPPVEETIPWEVFRGRLLDPAHTRLTRPFLSWNIYQRTAEGLSQEAMLSIKWDRAAGDVHVVRGILCYVWEGYDAGNNVIES